VGSEYPLPSLLTTLVIPVPKDLLLWDLVRLE